MTSQSDRLDNVVNITRNDNADGNLSVHREISGIQSATPVIKAHLAANALPQFGSKFLRLPFSAVKSIGKRQFIENAKNNFKP
jgi:hypothetical protein